MLALCLALKSAGHDVLLVGPPEKALWAKQLGCPYMGFGRDVTRFIDTMEDAVTLRSGFAFVAFVRQEIHNQFKALPNILKGADLVIGSSLMFGLSSIAQALKINYRYIAFTPQLFPSKDHPFLTIKTQTLPLWCNSLSWKLAAWLDRFNITFMINQYRNKSGLGSIKNGWEHILGKLPIVACDREVARIPGDIQKVIQTGYLHLDMPKPCVPDLEEFLLKGARPVYAGFGSMPPRDQAKMTPLLVRAARNVGKRIIISKFWQTSLEYKPGNDVFFLKNYPHRWLFPETDAVIHHGGAGTTATAAVSGVPQVVIPHILDQYFHGHRIYRARLGPKPVRRSKLTEKKLTAALEECMSSIEIKENAGKTGQRINPEKSLQRTVQAIETL